MFKRYKSLLFIITVLTLFVGGNQFVIDAAAIEGEHNKQNNITTYDGTSDEAFYQMYQQLLEQWNVRYEPHYPTYDHQTDSEEPNIEEGQVDNNESVEEKSGRDGQTESSEQVEQENESHLLDDLNQFEREMFELTNIERVNNGLQPLEIDIEVSKVAREKSRDMAVNSYFDHNSPVYGSPFDMMRSFGITYQAAGENIAKGQRSPEEVVQAWMNSPGHRANILNPNFTHIGVGFVQEGNHWTQQFIGK